MVLLFCCIGKDTREPPNAELVLTDGTGEAQPSPHSMQAHETIPLPFPHTDATPALGDIMCVKNWTSNQRAHTSSTPSSLPNTASSYLQYHHPEQEALKRSAQDIWTDTLCSQVREKKAQDTMLWLCSLLTLWERVQLDDGQSRTLPSTWTKLGPWFPSTQDRKCTKKDS